MTNESTTSGMRAAIQDSRAEQFCGTHSPARRTRPMEFVGEEWSMVTSRLPKSCSRAGKEFEMTATDNEIEWLKGNGAEP